MTTDKHEETPAQAASPSIQATTTSNTVKAQTNNPQEKNLKKLVLSALLVVVAGATLGTLVGWTYTSFSKSNSKPIAKLNEAPGVKADENPFKIGMIVPLTGDGASYGTNAKEIALLLEKELNTKGGIGGREVQFIFEDGQCIGDAAKTAAEKLIKKDKVDYLYGGECSDEMLASAPIAQEAKIITVSSGATSPKVSALGKYVFRTAVSDELGGKVAAQYAFSKLNKKSAIVLNENTNYAIGLKEVFKQEFTRVGGKVLFDQQYDSGETDFSDVATKAKAQSPDIFYVIPQTPIPGVLSIKALESEGLKIQTLTAEVMLARDEVAKHGKILEGMIGIEAYFDKETPRFKELSEKFVKEYGREVAYPTDLGDIYDLVYIYKEAYEAVGSNDTDKISKYLHNLKEWQGTSNTITFNENGDIISKPYGIYQVQNNEVKLLEKFTPQL